MQYNPKKQLKWKRIRLTTFLFEKNNLIIANILLIPVSYLYTFPKVVTPAGSIAVSSILATA